MQLLWSLLVCFLPSLCGGVGVPPTAAVLFPVGTTTFSGGGSGGGGITNGTFQISSGIPFYPSFPDGINDGSFSSDGATLLTGAASRGAAIYARGLLSVTESFFISATFIVPVAAISGMSQGTLGFLTVQNAPHQRDAIGGHGGLGGYYCANYPRSVRRAGMRVPLGGMRPGSLYSYCMALPTHIS
jgi:hypothetical protein